MSTPTRWATTVAGALALCAAALTAGCDDGSGSGTTATNTGTSGPIDRLADDPQSLYGRSAGYARDVAEQASQSGADATGLANELGGGGGQVKVAGLTWTASAAWASEAPAPMREAQFSVPGGASVYWSHFPGGQGGTVQANIERWAGQVLDRAGSPAEPATEQLTVAGVPVTTVRLEGTYLDGPPGGTKVERRRWALMGAIIEGPQGLVFIKMTGPQAAVSGAAGAFDATVRSMRR